MPNPYTFPLSWSRLPGFPSARLVLLGQFHSGYPVFGLQSPFGEPLARVNVEPTDLTPFREHPPHVLVVKDYSENEGLALALRSAGILQFTGESISGPWDSHFYLMALTPKLREHFEL